jgi:hypothetical protein
VLDRYAGRGIDLDAFVPPGVQVADNVVADRTAAVIGRLGAVYSGRQAEGDPPVAIEDEVALD